MSPLGVTAVLLFSGMVYVLLAWNRVERYAKSIAIVHVSGLLLGAVSVLPLISITGNWVLAPAYALVCCALAVQEPRAPVSMGLGLATFGLPAYLLLIDILHNGVEYVEYGPYVGAFLFASAVLLFVRAGGVPLGTVVFTLISVIMLGAVVSLTGGGGARPCDTEKCTPLGYLWTGGFVSENLPAALGGFLVVLLVAFGSRLYADTRLLAAVFVLGVLTVTGSRTPVIAAAVALAWFLLSNARLFTALVAKQFINGILAGAGILSLVLLVTAKVDDFSNRGRTWLGVKTVLDRWEGWVFGVGPTSWEYLQLEGFLSFHFAHSVYVLVIFSGGIVGLAIYLLLLRAWARRSIDLFGPSSATPIIYMVVLGLMEVSWNPASLDGLSLLMVYCLALRPYSTAASVSTPPHR